MNRAIVAVVTLLATLSALLWIQNQAAQDAAANDQADAPEPIDDGSAPDPSEDAALSFDQLNPFSLIEQSSMNASATDAQSRAWIGLVSYSEGTDQAPDPYRCCYGYAHTVQDMSRHPAEWYTDANGNRVREWGGESLANLGPSYAGLVSTAAGIGQINLPTWRDCAKALALPDFSPASQDAAILYLTKVRGNALDLVKAGQVDQAVQQCAAAHLWASFPGANAPGQGQRSLASLEAAFTDQGGTLA